MRKNKIETIKHILGNPKFKEEWQTFYTFCEMCDKGLRKESFKVLDDFIIETSKWNLEEKIIFLDWLFAIIDTTSEPKKILVFPFVNSFIFNTFEEWSNIFPDDFRPHKYRGLYFNDSESELYLMKALELSKSKEPAVIKKLMDKHFDSLWYSTHHFPHYYLGEFNFDMKTINKLEELCLLLEDREIATEYKSQINYYRLLIMDWDQFDTADDKTTFADWCKLNKREYEWVKTYEFDK